MTKPRRKKIVRRERSSSSSGTIVPKVTLHKLDWLEWVTIALCIWLVIHPDPYKLIFTLVLLCPIAGLLMNGVSRPSLASLVSVSNKQGKSEFDLADFIEFPGLAITIRVLVDFQFESFYSVLKVGTIGFILLLVVLVITHGPVASSNKKKWLIYSLIIANIALYSYGATYGVNCIYDDSNSKRYEAKVFDKSISTSKRSKRYYLEVEPWGHHRDRERVRVTQTKYETTAIGETVTIVYKEGLLNIPWYYIRE